MKYIFNMVDPHLFNKLYTAINKNTGKKIQVLFTKGGKELMIYFKSKAPRKPKGYRTYTLTRTMSVAGDKGIGRYQLYPEWDDPYGAEVLYFILYADYKIKLNCYDMAVGDVVKRTKPTMLENYVSSIDIRGKNFTLTLNSRIGCLKL